jgi:ABC-2 type transport system permease protein
VRSVALLAVHNVRLVLRERSSWVWLFIVPLVFVYFMGLAMRGPGGPEVARPRVQLDNRDGGFLGRTFVRELGEQGLEVVGEGAQAERGVTIPADFTERVLARSQVKLHFFTVEGSDDAAGAIVEVRLMRALVAINGRLVEHAVKSGGAPPTESALDALLAEPAAVSVEASYAGRKPRPVGFALSLPGNIVMYLFLNLLVFGGASVAHDRRSGVMRRLATSPLSRRDLVLGRLAGLELLAAAQVAVFLLAGQLLFGVDVGANLGGIVLVLLVFSWVAASLGVLVGSLARAEEKVIGLGLLIALPMAALGGCWWPIELVPRALQVAALATPTGWALAALHQLITFGSGLAGVVRPLAVLAAFGAAANLAAMRFFRV